MKVESKNLVDVTIMIEIYGMENFRMWSEGPVGMSLWIRVRESRYLEVVPMMN